MTGVSAGETGPSLRSGRADLADVVGRRYGCEAEQSDDEQSTRHVPGGENAERAVRKAHGQKMFLKHHQQRFARLSARAPK